MKPLALHRVAVVRPFVQFLGDIGAPVEREFLKARLSWTGLENLDNYLPSDRFYVFLCNAARTERIADLGYLVGKKYGPSCVDPHLRVRLCQSPTLYEGLLKACDLVNSSVSNCQVGLIQPPASDKTLFFHRPSCPPENPAAEQIVWFGLTAFIEIVRLFAGPQWQPPRLGVLTRHTSCHSIRERFAQTRIRSSQHYSYIALDNELLNLPPLTQHVSSPELSATHHDALPRDWPGSVRKIMIAYLQERDLSINLIAELCNVSTRTLQRRLCESGICYSELLDGARYDVASRMLQDPNTNISDIARTSGYANPTHFTRAFRRISGISPLAFRRQLVLST